jgi:hypothetical protein
MSEGKVLSMANAITLMVLPGADLSKTAEPEDGCFKELSVATQRQSRLQRRVACLMNHSRTGSAVSGCTG